MVKLVEELEELLEDLRDGVYYDNHDKSCQQLTSLQDAIDAIRDEWGV